MPAWGLATEGGARTPKASTGRHEPVDPCHRGPPILLSSLTVQLQPGTDSRHHKILRSTAIHRQSLLYARI